MTFLGVSVGEQKLVLNYPFENVRAELPKLESFDGMSGGLSPATFRWLTKKNRFITLGLEETGEETCEIKANNNSFSVSSAELVEAYSAIKTHLDVLPKPLPVLTQKEEKTVSVKASAVNPTESAQGA